MVLGATTLYLAAFVNFAALIARVNVTEGKIDVRYLCALGPTATADVPRWVWTAKRGDDLVHEMTCDMTPPQIVGWRDWGFRNWRVLNSLATQEARP